MIIKKNEYAGANCEYTNENNCTANVVYKVENGNLAEVNISGTFTKDGKDHSFWASRDASGNVNISGVPASVVADVAAEVAEIVTEVEAIAIPSNEENEENEE